MSLKATYEVIRDALKNAAWVTSGGYPVHENVQQHLDIEQLRTDFNDDITNHAYVFLIGSPSVGFGRVKQTGSVLSLRFNLRIFENTRLSRSSEPSTALDLWESLLLTLLSQPAISRNKSGLLTEPTQEGLRYIGVQEACLIYELTIMIPHLLQHN